MKKNLYYLSLLLGLVFGMTMFTACGGGDDDDNGGASGGTSGGEESLTPGKFMGPKRVFGDNLLSSYGGSSSGRELTYNSDDFVTGIKKYRIDANGQKTYSTEYEVTYSDKQVIVTEPLSSGDVKQYTFTIGSNGFAESYTSKKLSGSGKTALVKFEYDNEGHLTKIRAYEDGIDNPETWIGTLTWQDGNLTKANDEGKTYNVSYNSISNVTGLYHQANLGGDMGDFYEEEFHYMGLLGKATANLVNSYSRSSDSRTGENAWTLDEAGRPTKCVTTETESGSSSPSTGTYFWTYR